MEGCVCRKLPPWPPHHPSFGGVGDLDLLHFLHILSGGGWGRPAYPCIHASAGGSRGAPFVWGARAWIGFPIQSGPPRLAPWPSACSPCSLQPSVPHPLFHLFVPPPLSLSAVALFFVSPDPPPFCSPWPCPHPNTHPNTPQQCPAPHRGLPPGRQPDIHRDSPPPAFTWTFNGNTPSPGPLPGPLTGTSPFLPSSSFSFFLFSFPPAPVVAHPACQAGLGVPSRAPGPAQRVHPTPQDQWCSTGTRGRPTEEPQCTPIAPRALTRALNRSFLAGPGPWSLTGASCSSSSSSSLPSFTSIQVYFICCCFVVPPLPLSSPVLFFPSLPWGGYIYFTLCRFLILVRAAQCD